ncbi:hypothetical protein [Limnohabitans radicicola]|uniref:Uncharacterized protein n=1 Tax=Limnohabitans radicicola TaxID=2771427 RepID=A0A927FHG5_9BURK|nr:hypothetical protein [Limnohabitans radicicola]MBD8051061.1 hypothetical protein [Limnohabitans radicicola]
MQKLYSLAPRQLPALSTMVADLTNRHPEAIGNHLGVSADTVRRWLKAEQAPRASMLALFWETRWGLSALDAQAVNLVRSHIGLNNALRAENQNLHRRIQRLESIGQFGCANEPFRDSVHREPSLRHVR